MGFFHPSGYTHQDRENDALLVASMYHYILPLLAEYQEGRCFACDSLFSGSIQVDHLRYGPDVTLYDLQLVCTPCHFYLTISRGQWDADNRIGEP